MCNEQHEFHKGICAVSFLFSNSGNNNKIIVIFAQIKDLINYCAMNMKKSAIVFLLLLFVASISADNWSRCQAIMAKYINIERIKTLKTGDPKQKEINTKALNQLSALSDSDSSLTVASVLKIVRLVDSECKDICKAVSSLPEQKTLDEQSFATLLSNTRLNDTNKLSLYAKNPSALFSKISSFLAPVQEAGPEEASPDNEGPTDGEINGDLPGGPKPVDPLNHENKPAPPDELSSFSPMSYVPLFISFIAFALALILFFKLKEVSALREQVAKLEKESVSRHDFKVQMVAMAERMNSNLASCQKTVDDKINKLTYQAPSSPQTVELEEEDASSVESSQSSFRRKYFLSELSRDGVFGNSTVDYVPGKSIYVLITEDNTRGTFKVLTTNEAMASALHAVNTVLMPACYIKSQAPLPQTIVNEIEGVAVREGSLWRVTSKAEIVLEA